jgi:hypothetical protein
LSWLDMFCRMASRPPVLSAADGCSGWLSRICCVAFWIRSPTAFAADNLDQWKVEADRQLQELAAREYGKPIDELVAFLLPQLPSD